MKRLRWLPAAVGLFATAVVLGGCQDGHHVGPSAGGTAGTPNASGGGTATGGTASGGAGGQAGAPAGSIVVADHWSTELFANGPVMAALGAEAAIAYSGWSNDANVVSELLVHRIDAQGVRKGAVVRKPLGSDRPSLPAIASDGQRYLICVGLGSAGQIGCSSLAPDQDELVPVYSGPGFTPAVVHGAGGWLLAWRASEQAMTTIVLQALGTRFEAVGAPVSFPSTAASPTRSGSPFALAASPSGYVLVTGDPVRAQRLDGGLQTLGAPIAMGTWSFWSFSALAATDTAIALGLGEPYSAKLSLVDATNQVTTVSLVGGVKEGMPVGLVADHGTLAGVWPASSALDPSGWHFQHPLDQAPAPPPSSDPGAPGYWSFDTNLALARVGDGFVAAFAFTHDEIQVLRLGR